MGQIRPMRPPGKSSTPKGVVVWRTLAKQSQYTARVRGNWMQTSYAEVRWTICKEPPIRIFYHPSRLATPVIHSDVPTICAPRIPSSEGICNHRLTDIDLHLPWWVLLFKPPFSIYIYICCAPWSLPPTTANINTPEILCWYPQTCMNYYELFPNSLVCISGLIQERNGLCLFVCPNSEHYPLTSLIVLTSLPVTVYPPLDKLLY